MTMRPTALILVLSLLAPAAPAWADAPKAVIEGPVARKAGQSILLDARQTVSDEPLQWQLISPDVPFLLFDASPRKGTYLFIPDPEPGTYTVALTAVGKVEESLKADTKVVQVLVAEAAPPPPPPPPVPPVPPGPTPGPAPGPVPTPVPPVLGFRVLIVAESSANMTRQQLAVLNSTAVVDYLNRKTVKGADGRASWRKWDPDVDTSNETEVWKQIWAASKPLLTTLPMVVIINEQKGTAYPLPETEAAMLDLLKQYGGP